MGCWFQKYAHTKVVPMFSVLIVLLIIVMRNMVHFEMRTSFLNYLISQCYWRKQSWHCDEYFLHICIIKYCTMCACNLLKAYTMGIQSIIVGPCVCFRRQLRFMCSVPQVATNISLELLGIMIFAYDLYELFMYGVVCHFTLH